MYKPDRPTFDQNRERAEQRGDEWPYGSISVDLAAVPLTDRQNNLPAGVLQYNNIMDTNGCASRGPLNILETKLDWFYNNGMHPAIQKWCDDNGYRVNGKFALCDAFIEILSGTTPQGNSLKAPLDTIRKCGVIPAALIPLEDNMTWGKYMNPSRVTDAHKQLGAEFLRRLTINYEQVPLSQFPSATSDDCLDVAIGAYGPLVDGVYQKTDMAFNHVVDRFTNDIDIFDNYDPFIKKLAADYVFFDWGYSLSIVNQIPYPDETLALFDVLQKYGLLAFFAEAYKRLVSAPLPQAQTPPAPSATEASGASTHEPLKPTDMGTGLATAIYSAAYGCIGTEIYDELDPTVPKEVGCVQSVCEVLKKAGISVPAAGLYSVNSLIDWLPANGFTEIDHPTSGAIVTAHQPDRDDPRFAHTGICGKTWIMSNDSLSGIFDANYSYAGWQNYFATVHNSQVRYFAPAV